MVASDITILTARRRYRHCVPLDYEYDTERNDQYRSLWCEKCNAYSALSCMCLKKQRLTNIASQTEIITRRGSRNGY